MFTFRSFLYVKEILNHAYNNCLAVQVNPDLISQLESAGLSFVGKDETGKRMEVCL